MPSALMNLAATVFKARYELLLRVAARITRNIHVAEEVIDRTIHDILSRPHLNLPDDDGGMFRYIALAVQRDALDWMSETSNRARLEDNVRNEQKQQEHEDYVKLWEARIAVRKAVGKLSPRDQYIAWQILAYDATISEVSKFMEMTRVTIRGRLRKKIIPFLRQELAEYAHL